MSDSSTRARSRASRRGTRRRSSGTPPSARTSSMNDATSRTAPPAPPRGVGRDDQAELAPWPQIQPLHQLRPERHDQHEVDDAGAGTAPRPARTGRPAPAVAEGAPYGPDHRLVEVRVIVHDDGVLAAHLGRGLGVAARRLISRPTGREPVNEITSTRGSSTSACPTVSPGPGTNDRTPVGRPASSRMATRCAAMTGDCSAGFTITGFPVTSAPSVIPQQIASGKFHGEITTATPRGWYHVSSSSPMNAPSRVRSNKCIASRRVVLAEVDRLARVRVRLAPRLPRLLDHDRGKLIPPRPHPAAASVSTLARTPAASTISRHASKAASAAIPTIAAPCAGVRSFATPLPAPSPSPPRLHEKRRRHRARDREIPHRLD